VSIPVHWQKSSFSSEGSACLELATTADGRVRLFRESDEPSTVLTTTPTRIRALLLLAKTRGSVA
jgi:uncharacterized protein DUF397